MTNSRPAHEPTGASDWAGASVTPPDRSTRPEAGPRPSADVPPPVPAHAPTVYLHIGTMKTGTSYVQGNLERLQGRLEQDGILYPGSAGPAVHDILGRRGRVLGKTDQAWERLAAQARTWRGQSVIVSMEFLTLATDEQIHDIVESLRPAQVQVILTARDLARTIPSAWQQTTKNRKTLSWNDFLAGISQDDPATSKSAAQFWNHHDIATIVARWAAMVGADHVRIVTLPPSGAPKNVLWERFCEAVDIPAGTYDPDDEQRPNSSLGFAEAEMMRRLNLELDRGVDQASYRSLVTGYLSRQVLRRSTEPTDPPELPSDTYDWSVRRSERVVDELSRSGATIVGSLTDLVPQPRSGIAAPPLLTPDETAVSAAAIRAVAALVRRIADDEGGVEAKTRRRQGPRSGSSQREPDARRARQARPRQRRAAGHRDELAPSVDDV